MLYQNAIELYKEALNVKKRIWIPIVIVILLGVLLIPIPTGVMKDGGTRTYTALTYKIIDWNRISGDGVYENTRVYFGKNYFKSIDELWELEEVPEQPAVTEGDYRYTEYGGAWLDKTTAEKYDNDIFDHIIISKIYSDCFFANTVIPMPYQIKMNGTLSDGWCVGDQVICTYENTYYDANTHHVEADMLTIKMSDWQPDPDVCYKPVIYLYPEKETEVSVNLTLDGGLTCTYPAYNDGWTVTAHPDGTLFDKDGKQYNYLYWEGDTLAEFDFTEGFCVKGEDSAQFLEKALEDLGLTRREANEFIVYWLPIMEQNKYNVISFQSDVYTDAARLDIAPAPDTLIRVFMAFKGSEEFVKIPEQKLEAPKRHGFTAVEWGGTEIK